MPARRAIASVDAPCSPAQRELDVRGLEDGDRAARLPSVVESSVAMVE